MEESLKTGRERDIFLSYASEDRAVAARLHTELTLRGLDVWFDQQTILIGDNFAEVISEGLTHARFGLLLVSPDSMRKAWPQREFAALLRSAEVHRILPVLHRMTPAELERVSPGLARVRTLHTKAGLDHIVGQVLQAVSR